MTGCAPGPSQPMKPEPASPRWLFLCSVSSSAAPAALDGAEIAAWLLLLLLLVTLPAVDSCSWSHEYWVGPTVCSATSNGSVSTVSFDTSSVSLYQLLISSCCGWSTVVKLQMLPFPTAETSMWYWDLCPPPRRVPLLSSMKNMHRGKDLCGRVTQNWKVTKQAFRFALEKKNYFKAAHFGRFPVSAHPEAVVSLPGD